MTPTFQAETAEKKISSPDVKQLEAKLGSETLIMSVAGNF